MTKLIILSAIFCLSPLTHADEEQARIKALMHTFLIEMSRINPYLYSEDAFHSVEGRRAVESSLSTLEQKLQNPPSRIADKTGFRITFALLSDHISKTKAAFNRGELDYARVRLNGTTNLCAACHMQTPKISPHSSLAAFVLNSNHKPTYDSATFQFSVRRYDEALKQFDLLVRQYPQSGLASDHLADLYRRKLSIFARIKRDPKAAIENLNEDLKNAKIPVDVRQNIKVWISTFAKWNDELQDPAKLKTKALIEYVAQKLPPQLNRRIGPADPDLLNLLRYSGLLYERLFSEDEVELTQALLFHLAQTERSLSPFPWYSLNEIYLKECVVRFPKQALTRKCYEAYQEGMKERYFGRTVPDTVQNSIDALKEYL